MNRCSHYTVAYSRGALLEENWSARLWIDAWIGMKSGLDLRFPVGVNLEKEVGLAGADGRLTRWILWAAELSDSTLTRKIPVQTGHKSTESSSLWTHPTKVRISWWYFDSKNIEASPVQTFSWPMSQPDMGQMWNRSCQLCLSFPEPWPGKN